MSDLNPLFARAMGIDQAIIARPYTVTRFASYTPGYVDAELTFVSGLVVDVALSPAQGEELVNPQYEARCEGFGWTHRWRYQNTILAVRRALADLKTAVAIGYLFENTKILVDVLEAAAEDERVNQ